MNKDETNVLQWLTGKTTMEEVVVEELQQLTITYPYFSAAHLLLCKKMQQTDHPLLQQQLYKTALYFPDEQWLRYLMTDTSESIDFTDETKEIAEKKEPENEAKTNEAFVANSLQNDTESSSGKEKTTDTVENNLVENGIKKNGQKQTGNEDENLITLPVEAVLENFPSHFDVQAEPEEVPLDEEELLQQTEEPLPIEESNQKIASLLSGQAEEFNKPVTGEAEIKVETQPLHAVDYFASQGIKADEKKEENLLDKKVHKFTDWLRQMKRINPQPVDLGTDSEEESFVANIAASSNQTKEIITESMAEVLVKQSKKDKAVEIYEKLSLLYPLKNAYFAAKIQQIKQ